MSAHTLADDSHLSECLRSGLGTGSMTRFEEVAMDAPGERRLNVFFNLCCFVHAVLQREEARLGEVEK